MIRFDGARVVITGAGGGIGQVLTAQLSRLGASIVACDVEGADLSAAHITERHAFDLRDADGTAAAAQAILANGPPTIVISNAGWTRQDTMDQTTAAGIAEEMDANFTGAARLTHALLPAMRSGTGNRAFVFVASVNALTHHGNPAYSAAKAALLAWMRALAVEEGRYGIRANAVIPASVRTNAWVYRLAADPGVMDRVSALYPLGRIVTTDEVANAVAFLASDAASGITGTSLTVDCGLMAGNLPFLDAIRPR
jgi:NAD(P)-dependent dehydrogenase (short-subunit alcohol dehydrogenase family)